MQECTRMNRLISEIRRSLEELEKGMSGALNMSEAMEDLVQALSIQQVPGRNPFHKCSWEKLAWWSKKGLHSWFSDMLLRIDQLSSWSDELELPLVMWYPGLFNPMAFNTAVMCVTQYFLLSIFLLIHFCLFSFTYLIPPLCLLPKYRHKYYNHTHIRTCTRNTGNWPINQPLTT